MQAAEKKVETIGADIARLDAKLGDPQLYAKDPAAAQSAAIERGQLAKRLSEAEEAWLLPRKRTKPHTPTHRTPLRRKLSNSRDNLVASHICAICT